MHRRQCLQTHQKFCYICGSYAFDTKVRQIDSFVKKLYFSYFQLKVGDQDKSFAPHIACNTWVERDCVTGMTESGRQCRLQYPCNGASRRIIMITAILVWSTLSVTIIKTKKELHIRISYQLYGPFLMDLTYQYLVHLITWVANLNLAIAHRRNVFRATSILQTNRQVYSIRI
jgi:hypothetical protein